MCLESSGPVEKGIRIKLGYLLWAALILISLLMNPAPLQAQDPQKSLSIFPILMYDTNIGWGYGVRAKCVQFLANKESFDVIAFNSTKGERWYVFTFSIPDMEIRQGQEYEFSLDIKAEFDKYLKYYYFGLGPDSSETDRSELTFEKKELQVRTGRGIRADLIIEVHYVLKNVAYLNVEEDKPFTGELREVGYKFSPFLTLLLRYDTSDSQIHPRTGHRLIVQSDIAARILGNAETRFHRLTLDFRKYSPFLSSRDILAFRVLVQKISGSRLPLYEMSSLGGGSEMSVMRGFALNRFLDKGKFLLITEYRFPVWKRLGATACVEAGSVWPSLSKIDLKKTVVDIGFGLRYYLRNFIVRFDTGISKEGIGMYFNFGHVF